MGVPKHLELVIAKIYIEAIMVSGIEINGRKTDIIGSSLYYNGVRIGSINQSKGVITLNETGFNVVSYELTPDEIR